MRITDNNKYKITKWQ